MECGVRALGNRSINSSRRNFDIKNVLNIKIREESFFNIMIHQFYQNI